MATSFLPIDFKTYRDYLDVKRRMYAALEEAERRYQQQREPLDIWSEANTANDLVQWFFDFRLQLFNNPRAPEALKQRLRQEGRESPCTLV